MDVEDCIWFSKWTVCSRVHLIGLVWEQMQRWILVHKQFSNCIVLSSTFYYFRNYCYVCYRLYLEGIYLHILFHGTFSFVLLVPWFTRNGQMANWDPPGQHTPFRRKTIKKHRRKHFIFINQMDSWIAQSDIKREQRLSRVFKAYDSGCFLIKRTCFGIKLHSFSFSGPCWDRPPCLGTWAVD